MSIQTLRDQLPDYAKDLKLNLGNLANETVLSEVQKAGTFIATAIASRNPQVIAAVVAEFGPKLDPVALNAVKAASAIMAMNNVYYRFVHLATNKDYATMPARLRMNVIGNPGIDKLDFELLSLAVSAVNGCGMCVVAHEKQLRKHEVSREAIQSAVRIAATIHAVAGVLEHAETAAVPTAAAA